MNLVSNNTLKERCPEEFSRLELNVPDSLWLPRLLDTKDCCGTRLRVLFHVIPEVLRRQPMSNLRPVTISKLFEDASPSFLNLSLHFDCLMKFPTTDQMLLLVPSSQYLIPKNQPDNLKSGTVMNETCQHIIELIKSG